MEVSVQGGLGGVALNRNILFHARPEGGWGDYGRGRRSHGRARGTDMGGCEVFAQNVNRGGCVCGIGKRNIREDGIKEKEKIM